MLVRDSGRLVGGGRPNNIQHQVQVASRLAGQTFAAQPQFAALFTTRRDTHFDFAGHRGRMHFTAQGGFPRRHRQFQGEVAPNHLIKRMFSKVNRQEQIACRTATLTRHALPRQTDHLPSLDPRWDLDTQGAIHELWVPLRIELHRTQAQFTRHASKTVFKRNFNISVMVFTT